MEVSSARVAAMACIWALAILAVGPDRVEGITLTQAMAPMPILTADPHQGGGDGVVDADTKEPAKLEAPNNVVLLVAALGVLIGVLIVARPRRGPKL